MAFEWTDKALFKTILGDLKEAQDNLTSIAHRGLETNDNYLLMKGRSYLAKAIATLEQNAPSV
jgi:hypothetical protein